MKIASDRCRPHRPAPRAAPRLDARRRRSDHRRRRRGASRGGRGRGRRRGGRLDRCGPRRRRRDRHRRRDLGPRRADPRLDRARPPDVLREAAVGRPRGHDRVAGEIERSGVPFQLGFQRRFDAGYRGGPAAGRDRRAGHALRRSPRRPRSGAAPRELHSPVGRSVPRLFDPRLRYPPLADRSRGRGGLCRRRRPRLSGLRQVRRRRHGRRDPAPDDGRAGRADLRPPRPARLRHPGRAVRLARLDQRRPRAADADALRRAGGPAAGRAGLVGLHRPVRAGLRSRIRRIHPVARREVPSPCTARDGVAAMRIAEAATRSLHEHRPVRLEEIPG